MFDFADRVVMVTGAAGNLGRAVAQAFRAAGAKMVLVDRAEERLPRLFPDLADSSDHFLATSVDVLDPGAIAGVVGQALERFGKIDVLANTVGGWRGGKPVHETPPETWDMLFNLNARTAAIISREVIPPMLEQGYGKIIHVGASAALQGGKRSAAYSASKSAVLRLAESMAAELKGTGINVNCVAPKVIDTPQNREAMPKADHSRWVRPEAIAEVILFLASEAALAVHGAVIPVYGNS